MCLRLLRHLLPGRCLLCDGAVAAAVDLDLCLPCRAALPWNQPACLRCAQPLPAAAAAIECSGCRRWPPPFRYALAPLRYEGCARLWVQRLKDHLGMVEGRVLATVLAEAAADFYRRRPDVRRPDLLVPVPLGAWRLARRGHNQAVTLAAPVARRLGVPLRRTATRRLRRTPSQRGLGRRQRLANPAGNFACRLRWPEPGPCVGLVDDVLTTGATVAELARVLLAAGAAEVHVLCATRTAPPGWRPRLGGATPL